MKKTILLASHILIAFDATIPSFAYNETDLEKLKKLNSCERCDLREAYLHGIKLSGANLRFVNLYKAILSGADLRGTDLSGANLGGANLGGAKYCKTQMPSWEERNDHCWWIQCLSTRN